MNNRIKDFVNDHYMSFGFSDLIIRIFGFFVYTVMMIIPWEIIAFDIQEKGFGYISFTSHSAVPVLVASLVLSALISIVTVSLYVIKTKWSVFAIRGVAIGYVSLILLILSCFSEISGDVLYIFSVVIKIVGYICSVYFYARYLVKKRLSKFNPKENGYEDGMQYIALTPMLVVLIKPLLNVLFSDGENFISFYPILTGIEYIVAIGLVINLVESFAKAYYSRKLNIN